MGETLKSGTRVRVARGLSREDRFFGKVWILCLSRQTKENGTAVCLHSALLLGKRRREGRCARENTGLSVDGVLGPP